jgi:hypothetical protein
VSLLLILSVFCVVIFWFALGWEGGGSMLLILLVFCVVLFCLFIGGVFVAHPVSLQCCGIFGEGWGVYVAHLVGFMCCFFGDICCSSC